RRGIHHLAPIYVLPHRFVTILANNVSIGRRSAKNTPIEVPEIAELLIAGVQLVVAHETPARRSTHLKHQHDRSGRILLRTVESTFRKVSECARGQVTAGSEVHRSFKT